jgi:hypothetical protein
MDKMISTKPGEYPELDGLPMGASVHFEGDAELVEGGLRISSIQMEPSDNEATREVNRMTKGQEYAGGTTSRPSSSGF